MLLLSGPRCSRVAATCALCASLWLSGCGDSSTDPKDSIPPGAITDLSVAAVGDSSVTLTWTAVGDDGTTGTASGYEVRFAEISDRVSLPWSGMPSGPVRPDPAPAGTRMEATLGGLLPGTSYAFSVGVEDEGEIRTASSSARGFTTPPNPGDHGWWAGFAGNGFDGMTVDLEIHEGSLYACGDFTHSGPIENQGLARWDGREWRSVVFDLRAGRISALKSLEGDLYAAGSFRAINLVEARSIARWDGIEWNSVGQGLFGSVDCLAEFEGDLVAAGEFSLTEAGETIVVARFDSTGWHPLGGLQGVLVGRLLERDGMLVAAFQDVEGGRDLPFLNRWDGQSWVPLADESPGQGAVTVFREEWIAGSLFLLPEDHRFGMRWTGSEWRPLMPGVNGSILAFLPLAEELVVGGEFTRLDQVPAGGLARWDGRSWSLAGSGVAGPFAMVRDLILFRNDVFVAGSFETAGGKPSPNIARWEPASR